MPTNPTRSSTRVQTGVRIEKRLLKVLKALAAHKDITLGDLIEGIVLHSFENKLPFNDDTLRLIDTFRQAYGLEMNAEDGRRLAD
jgi:hypothetical protein